MTRIVFSDLADEDLIDIWVGIAPDNEAAADRIVDEIHEVTPMLITYPLLGRAADELRTGARAFVHGNYLVIYRPMDYGSPYYAWHTEPAISRRLEFHRRRTSRPAASPCEATHSAPERT